LERLETFRRFFLLSFGKCNKVCIFVGIKKQATMLVNKGIARKLRDAGFREPTDYLYNHIGEKKKYLDADSGNQLYADKGFDNCDAPEKDDVFAWFRGKGIVGFVQLSVDFHFIVFNKNTEVRVGESFPTWEQAEDACIEEMIKLIQ
jgi:hypothetical protein